MNTYYFMFYTHGNSVRISRELTKEEIEFEVIPAPRELSSSCGVSIVVKTDHPYTHFIDDDHIERIYTEADGEYKLLHKAQK